MANIALVGNYSLGMYRFRKELILALRDAGHRVTVIVPDEEYAEELRAMGVSLLLSPMDRRGTDPRRDMALVRWYKAAFREIAPDLVVTYTIKPNVYAGMVCRSRKIPYAANVTGLGTVFEKAGSLKMKAIGTLVTLMYRRALGKAGAVFFENDHNRQLFVDAKLVTEWQAVLVPGAGINTEDFPLQPMQEHGDFRFLFVGRVMKEKGVAELLAAMKMLRDRGVNCSLDVVGIPEENFRAEFAEGAEAGWLRDHGFQKDVRPFFAACDCFVLPSWHEGMANTNLEAAASGRPVITSDIPGCREEVIPGKTGWLFDRSCPERLAEIMETAVRTPKEKLREMGLAGREHAVAVFDKKKVVSKTAAVLNGMLDQ